GYPASAGWSLLFRLIGRAGGFSPVEIPALPEDDAFRATLSAGATEALTPGHAMLAAFVVRDDEKITLGAQPVEILPNLSTAAASRRADRRRN
ncbi:MAG: hypothetical protein LBJ76_07230, partial [Candidatus Accumulibacter sp.]|nr:hypothetical protein [Accumulibacter sp.]